MSARRRHRYRVTTVDGVVTTVRAYRCWRDRSRYFFVQRFGRWYVVSVEQTRSVTR